MLEDVEKPSFKKYSIFFIMILGQLYPFPVIIIFIKLIGGGGGGGGGSVVVLCLQE